MRRTQGEWAQIVARYRASGLSVRRFTADEGVSEQSLRNWTRKLDEPRALQRRNGSGFVEIGETVRQGLPTGEKGAIAAGDGLVIRLENDVCLEVGPRTDRELLAWVLALLGHGS
jgi:transposase-like protein